MRVAVIALSCRGVMGLAAVAFCNAIAKEYDVNLFSGAHIDPRELDPRVGHKSYPVTGQAMGEVLRKLSMVAELMDDLKKLSPDIVVFYSSHVYNPLVLRDLRRWNPSVRTLFIFHDPVERAQYGLSKQSLYNWGMKLHNWYMVRFTDMIQVTFEAALDQVVAHYNVPRTRCVSVPLVPLSTLRSVTDQPVSVNGTEAPYDIAVYGRIDRYKDFDTLFNALKVLEAEGSSLRVLMILQGRIDERLGRRILETSHAIRVINRFLPEREFEELLSSCKIAVFCYSAATGSHGPLVAAELGLPVVATAVGCFPEYVGEFGTGECVPPREPTVLAAAIKRWVASDINRNQIRNRMKQATKRTIDRQLEVLESLRINSYYEPDYQSSYD